MSSDSSIVSYTVGVPANTTVLIYMRQNKNLIQYDSVASICLNIETLTLGSLDLTYLSTVTLGKRLPELTESCVHKSLRHILLSWGPAFRDWGGSKGVGRLNTQLDFLSEGVRLNSLGPFKKVKHKCTHTHTYIHTLFLGVSLSSFFVLYFFSYFFPEGYFLSLVVFLLTLFSSFTVSITPTKSLKQYKN